MRIRCGNCGLDVEIPPGSDGRTFRCPHCGDTFICRVPEAIPVDAPPAPPPGNEVLELLDEIDDEPVELTDELDDASALAEAAAARLPAHAVLAELGAAAPKREVRENPRQWFVMIGGVAAVALTYEELAAKAAAGAVKPKDKIHYAPKDVTVAARDVPGLFPAEDARRAEDARPKIRRRRLNAEQRRQRDDLADALGRLGRAEPAKGDTTAAPKSPTDRDQPAGPDAKP